MDRSFVPATMPRLKSWAFLGWGPLLRVTLSLHLILFPVISEAVLSIKPYKGQKKGAVLSAAGSSIYKQDFTILSPTQRNSAGMSFKSTPI